MIRALVIKELRESLGPVALAAVAVAAALASLWGVPLTPWHEWQPTQLPFVHDGLYSWLPWIGGSLAVILAMKQTAWEEMKATFHFLWHRPVLREYVVMVKIGLGLALILAVTAIFILLHGMWSATPGKHGSPFFWSMTVPAWRTWFALPVVYLAAFLSGLRPGRWYGSRLLPLAAGGLFAFALGMQPWWWIAVLGSALGSALLIVAIRYVALVRDY